MIPNRWDRTSVFGGLSSSARARDRRQKPISYPRKGTEITGLQWSVIWLVIGDERCARRGGIAHGGTDQPSANGLIPIGASATSASGGVGFTFVPLSDGTTTLTLSSTAFSSATTNVGPASQLVTVSQPGFTMNIGEAASGTIGIGAGLEMNAGSISLADPAPSGGTTIQVTSSDTTKVVLSKAARSRVRPRSTW